MTRHFFAPGKVVVLGEYAVTDGAPAIVAAVDHGVAVTYTPASAQRVTTPTGDTRFVDAALVDAPVGAWTFVDQPAATTASKPGLGGSAAATVVARFAARTLLGLPDDRAALFAEALAAHRAVQGSGSGVDVAASTRGGFLRFDPADPACSATVPAPRFAVVWSGQSARTGPRVQAYKAWSGREAFVRESASLTDAFAHDPVAAVRGSRRLLVAMSESAGLDYRTPELDRLADLAEACGGAGKPSGAGGGDCLIAVFPDDDARDAFVAAAGPGVLPLRLSAGVHEQRAAEAARPG